MELTLITGNPKKSQEIASAIHPNIQLLHQHIDIHEPQSIMLEEISAHKAMEARNLLHKPLIIDDTAIYFDAYNNFPGPFAKFTFQQLGFEGFAKLLDNTETRKWRMTTVISYMNEWLQKPLQFKGEVMGHFTMKTNHKDIDSHMPYNHIFIPEGRTTTVHDNYTQRITSNDNHRARAIKHFNKRRETL